MRSAMAVLHPSHRPALGDSPLSEMMGIEMDDQGFVKGLSSPFEPAATRIKGVFAAGFAGGPRTLTEAIRDGVSAAGRILSVLIPGEKLTLEPLAGEIDAERCSGCRLCAAVCPFGAIIFDGEKEVSVVVEEYCRACGTCVASCPSGAATAKHYTDEQIFAELKGLFSPISQEGG